MTARRMIVTHTVPMRRPGIRTLAAAALATAALVSLPQAAFAMQPALGGSSGPATAQPPATASVPRGPTASVPPGPPAPAPLRADSLERVQKATGTQKVKPTPTPTPTSTPTASPTPTPSVAATGADVSYPQCPLRLPANQLFGVIGVNGGTAKDFNGCLGAQLAWARATAGTTPQGTASLYVNTANAGSQSSWWPKSDSDQPVADPTAPGPRGALPAGPVTYPNGSAVGCSAVVDPFGPACSYVYGYTRAEQAVEYAQETLGAAYSPTIRWWLDVETSNTWVGPTTSNAASLAGSAAYLASIGRTADGTARVGVYSTTAQYRTIVGGTGSAVPALPDGEPSPLVGLPEWGAGATSLKSALSNCSAVPFTGGSVTMTQFVSGGLDYDISCRGY